MLTVKIHDRLDHPPLQNADSQFARFPLWEQSNNLRPQYGPAPSSWNATVNPPNKPSDGKAIPHGDHKRQHDWDNVSKLTDRRRDIVPKTISNH